MDFEPFLFNTTAHRKLQSKTDWTEFHILDQDRKKILSSIFFNLTNGIALSPLKAPFGSYGISNRLQPEVFFEFTIRIEEELRKKNIKLIGIVCPPTIYTSLQSLVTTTLMSQGYQLTQAEAGSCILVDEKSLTKKMYNDKLNRYKKAQKAGLSFNKITLTKLSEVYDFIDLYRKKLNRTLSMTKAQLQKTVEALPDSFFIVGVYLDSELVAACICVRVSKFIVYTFYSAHSDKYDKLSPRVFLLKNLYDLCYKQGVTLLDLGTSMVNQKPNFSLLDFKFRMGGSLTLKYKFQKELLQ